MRRRGAFKLQCIRNCHAFQLLVFCPVPFCFSHALSQHKKLAPPTIHRRAMHAMQMNIAHIKQRNTAIGDTFDQIDPLRGIFSPISGILGHILMRLITVTHHHVHMTLMTLRGHEFQVRITDKIFKKCTLLVEAYRSTLCRRKSCLFQAPLSSASRTLCPVSYTHLTLPTIYSV